MKNSDDFIKKYTDVAIEHGNALMNGDHRVANKAYAKLTRLYKELEQDHLFAEHILRKLLQNDDDLVQVCAAAHALGLGLLLEDAQQTLVDVSNTDGIGIIQFEAEMTLKEWRKKGKLNF